MKKKDSTPAIPELSEAFFFLVLTMHLLNHMLRPLPSAFGELLGSNSGDPFWSLLGASMTTQPWFFLA